MARQAAFKLSRSINPSIKPVPNACNKINTHLKFRNVQHPTDAHISKCICILLWLKTIYHLSVISSTGYVSCLVSVVCCVRSWNFFFSVCTVHCIAHCPRRASCICFCIVHAHLCGFDSEISPWKSQSQPGKFIYCIIYIILPFCALLHVCFTTISQRSLSLNHCFRQLTLQTFLHISDGILKIFPCIHFSQKC